VKDPHRQSAASLRNVRSVDDVASAETRFAADHENLLVSAVGLEPTTT
jgi:hypothetical protein